MEKQSISQQKQLKRSIFLRIIFGFIWLIPIYFLSNIIIGGIVGAISGAATQSYEAGYLAGRTASIAFFQKYGLLVIFFQLLFTTLLTYFGKLPGTGKFKRIKKT